MRSVRRFRPSIIGGIVIGVFLSLAYGYHRFNKALRCDYYTVDVILMVEDYVKTHDGRWPSKWEDLAGTERCRSRGLEISAYVPYVSVDFTLTSGKLLEKPDLIYAAVTPSSSKYICYPDARLHLDRVLDAIRREHERNVRETTDS